MKVNRLFSIVHILLNRKHVTAKELADKLEVSTRTIYRDIETLSMSGIPIYTEKGSGGGISILENFVINKSVISEEEKNSIILGLEVLEATNYDRLDTAITKIKNLFNKNEESYIEIDFTDFNNKDQVKVFEDIKTSLKRNQTLIILYRNKSGQKTSRKINPLKLIFKQQRWYIIAYCYKRQDYRIFRISRIISTNITEEKFDRNNYDITNVELNSHGIINMKLITLTLDIKALFRIEEEFYSSMIAFQDEEKLIIEFESELDEWILSYIMSYADYLIDVEPKEVKDKIKSKARRIINL